jgi:outer membrane protein TolC
MLSLFSFVVLLSASSLSQELADPATFVHTILSRHPSLKRANELIRSAEFGVKASGLQPNPTLTLAATAGDAGEDSNALTQNLEISGQPSLRRNIADLNLKATIYQRDAVEREIMGSAYGAWLELWKTHRMLELAQLRTMLLNELARVAKRRFEVGEISENEALRVELASAEAQTDFIRAQAALDGARQSAALLLGVDGATFQPNPTEPTPILDEISLEVVLAWADDHPQIQGQFLKLSALELGAELIKKERAPIVGLSLYRSTLLNSSALQQGAQISISWPILDWGNIRNRAEQQRAEALAFQAQIEETLLQTRQQLARTWISLEAAKRNRDIIASQAERYEELAREARVAYDVGLWSLTDVLQTEQSYRQASVHLLEAKAEVFEQELQLLKNTGLSFPPELYKEDL